MQPKSVISRLAMTLAAGLLLAWVCAPSALAQPQPGDILVVDPDVPPLSTAVLFQVNPQTGARTVLSNFGFGGNPSAVALEADGGILVTDTDAGTDPSGGSSEWGVLYRLTPDPVTGDLVRTVLTDFGLGPNTGRTPRAVAVEADGQILVATTGIRGTLNDRALLVRVDPVTGARAIVSDFLDPDPGGVGPEPRGIAIEPSGAILAIDAQGGLNGLGVLVRIDPQTGIRNLVHDFNIGDDRGTTPTSVAIESTGHILVSDEGPIGRPLGGLFRIDPQGSTRTVLSDFNTGANTGTDPAGVAIEANGQILVIDRNAGPSTRGMLFRVDPQTGARAIVSDFAVGANGGGEPLALAVVPPTKGTLVVVNEVTNDNGGTAAASDWTMSVAGEGPAPASFPGSEAPGTTVTMDPGTYTVSASGPNGYGTSLSAHCDSTIAAGETKTCTVTHDDQPGRLVVVVEVVNDNGGTATASDWTIDVTGENPAPASFAGQGAPGTSVTLDAGSYSVDVSGPPGYSSTRSADCAATIDLAETKTCTITNDDEPGTLIVVNEVANGNGGTAVVSDWTMVVTGGNPLPASFPGANPPGTTVTLDSGSYSVAIARSLLPYDHTFSAGCSGTIAAGETKTCTVTHDDQPGTLIVIVDVINDNGGTAAPSDFDVSVSGVNPAPAGFFAGAGPPGTTVMLDPGSYYPLVLQSTPVYRITWSSGCSGTIAAGETKMCTLTADDFPPRLFVSVLVTNNDGGTAIAADWTVTVTGQNPVPASFPGGILLAPVTLDPGPYSVSVSGPAGYSTSYTDADCEGTIALLESKACVIILDDQPASLTVVNEVVNDNGGTAVAADWTVAVTGANPAPASFPGEGAPGTTVTLHAGAYSVSTDSLAGYSSTLSAGCAGTIAVGETRTCTITNNDQPATLVVIAEVVNDSGGTAVAGDFTAVIGLPPGHTGSPRNFPTQGPPGTTVTLDPGGYGVGVSGPLGQYYPDRSDLDCEGSIAAGETKTCTLVFDDIPSTLIVIEEVVNDNGGSASAGEFSVTVTGGDPSPASFPGAGAPGTSVTLDAGGYSVDVSGPPGYTSTLSPECAGTIGLGEGKTCTITSDDEPAILIVMNEVVNYEGGTAQPSDWTMTVTGTNPAPASFPGAAAPGTAVTIGPGAYSVAASGPTGYGSSPSADCAGTILLGQTKICTFTHEDQSARLRVDVNVVNDNGGSAVDSDWTISVAGENPTPGSFPGGPETFVMLFAGAYSVSESGPAGYSSTLSSGCAGTVSPGDTKICTIRVDDNLPGAPTCDGKPATIVAAPGQSLIQGTPGNDVIVALVGSHTVRGRDGNDTICTGTDFDVIEGGPGDDTIIDAGGVKNTVRGDAGIDSITTGDGVDAISGGSGSDSINAGGGNDGVNGEGDNDTINGGAGDDQISGGLGADTITDTDGHNTVLGNAGNDTITTGDGNDRIEAGSGNDALHAGAGANRVDGQGDADTIATGAGDDQIDGGAGADTITDSGGRNTVQGGDGNDVITTGDGADTIHGGSGNDVIDAGGGNNSVYGDRGNDTILAGAGDDLIDGGNDFDGCTPGGGLNTIWRCEMIT